MTSSTVRKGSKRIIPEAFLKHPRLQRLVQDVAGSSSTATSSGTEIGSSVSSSVMSTPAYPRHPPTTTQVSLSPATLIPPQSINLRPPTINYAPQPAPTQAVAQVTGAAGAAGAAVAAEEVGGVWQKYFGWFNWKWGVVIVLAAIILYVLVRFWSMMRQLGFTYAFAAAFPFLRSIMASLKGVPAEQMAAEIEAFQKGMHPIQRPELYMQQPPQALPPPSADAPPAATEPTKTSPSGKDKKSVRFAQQLEQPSPTKQAPVAATEGETGAETTGETAEQAPSDEAETSGGEEDKKEEEQQPPQENLPQTQPTNNEYDENGNPKTRRALVQMLLDEALTYAEYEREEKYEEQKAREAREIEEEIRREDAERDRQERNREAREQNRVLREQSIAAQRQQQDQTSQPPPSAEQPLTTTNSNDSGVTAENKERDQMRQIQAEHARITAALATAAQDGIELIPAQ